MLVMIVTVCTAQGISIYDTRKEVMCLRKMRVPDTAATCIVETADQVYNQAHDCAYPRWNLNNKADIFIEFDRHIHNA